MAVFIVAFIVTVLITVGIFCAGIYLHLKKKRLMRQPVPICTITRSQAYTIQRRQPFVARITGNADRINLRMERMERQIPNVHRVNTVSRIYSADNSATINNDIEPRSPPPPPLPPRSSTMVRNTTTVLTYNNREDVFQLPPMELSPVLARNSLLRSSRSSQFVRFPPGFLDLGFGTSQFSSGRGNNGFDLFPWLHGRNMHPQLSSNYEPENDLPPSYEEAMKMKATDADVVLESDSENTKL